MPKTFKVGEKYVIIGGDIIQQPILAEIFVITNTPGKMIGMKLPYKIVGASTLDDRIEQGLGLWVHPIHLLTEAEFKADSLIRCAPIPFYEEIKEFTFDPDTHQHNLPPIAVKDTDIKVPELIKAQEPVKAKVSKT